MAVFVGGFTVDAAIDVAGDGTLPEGAVVEGISLVDESLLLRQPRTTRPTAIPANRDSSCSKPSASLRSSWRALARKTRFAGPMRLLSGTRRARRARVARRRPGRLDRATRNGAAEPACRAGLVAGRRRCRDRTAPRRRALLVLVPAQPRCRRANLVRARSCGRTRTGRRGRQSGVGRGSARLACRVCDGEELRRRSPGAVRGVRRSLGRGRCRPLAGTPGRGPGARRRALDRHPRRLPRPVRGNRRRLGRRLFPALPRPGMDGDQRRLRPPPPC